VRWFIQCWWLSLQNLSVLVLKINGWIDAIIQCTISSSDGLLHSFFAHSIHMMHLKLGLSVHPIVQIDLSPFVVYHFHLLLAPMLLPGYHCFTQLCPFGCFYSSLTCEHFELTYHHLESQNIFFAIFNWWYVSFDFSFIHGTYNAYKACWTTMVSPIDHVPMNHQNHPRTNG
jgi:hypothetical protein